MSHTDQSRAEQNRTEQRGIRSISRSFSFVAESCFCTSSLSLARSLSVFAFDPEANTTINKWWGPLGAFLGPSTLQNLVKKATSESSARLRSELCLGQSRKSTELFPSLGNALRTFVLVGDEASGQSKADASFENMSSYSNWIDHRWIPVKVEKHLREDQEKWEAPGVDFKRHSERVWIYHANLIILFLPLNEFAET